MKKINFNFNIWKPTKIKSVSPIRLSLYPKRSKQEWNIIDKSPYRDSDRDKLMNWFDCRPLDKKHQGKFKQNIPLSEAEYLTVYHGTQKGYVKKILKKGLKKGKRDRIYLTPSKSAAILHAEWGPEKIVHVWAGTIPEYKKMYEEDIKRHKESLKELSEREKIWKKYKLDKELDDPLHVRKRLMEDKMYILRDIKRKKRALQFKPEPAILKIKLPSKEIKKHMEEEIVGRGYPVLQMDESLTTYRASDTFPDVTRFPSRYALEFKHLPRKKTIKEANFEKIKRKTLAKSNYSQGERPEALAEMEEIREEEAEKFKNRMKKKLDKLPIKKMYQEELEEE